MARLDRRAQPRQGRWAGAACAALLSALWLGASPAAASEAPRFTAAEAARCETAITEAAARHGTPVRLLRALALVETGRSIEGARRPWPWSVNAGGEGRWFGTRREALAWARERLSAGVASIDLGCMQINRIWHGEAFTDLGAMLDPRQNADYAARFLAELKAETGDWMRAAGYYHSRTKQHFDRYSALVASAYSGLGAEPPSRGRGLAPRPANVTGPGPRRVASARPPASAGPASPARRVFTNLARGGLFSSASFDARLAGRGAAPEPTAAAKGGVARGGVALNFGQSARPLVQKSRESWLKP
ncbi:MAG: lytic transglycosylase domain-containing protein [Pseudomonadota bacterium]